MTTPFEKHHAPKPDEEIYYGLAGKIVKSIEAETEADPVALLFSLFVAVGNIAGRNVYYEVEASQHYPNLFVVLVGKSGKARKGSSWNIAKKIFNEIDKDWVIKNNKSGLSSGEGLKYNVRDAVKKLEKGVEITTDCGIADKRLLIYEGEFASALKVANRPGNTLSTTIRDAWDTGNLSTLTKNDPIVATNAHISIFGHITSEELQRNLTETEAANGYANRFLWVYVQRSKKLPFGGNIPFEELPTDKLKAVIEFAETRRQIPMNPEAKEHWAKIYDKLSEPDTGLLGAITSRSEAQAVRLALIYALLDCSETIRKEHLQAALALWEYCYKSAKFIFGEKFGDETADAIFNILKQNGNGGITATELHKHFGNNKNKNDIERWLSVLFEADKIKKRAEQTTGRPTTIYEINEKN